MHLSDMTDWIAEKLKDLDPTPSKDLKLTNLRTGGVFHMGFYGANQEELDCEVSLRHLLLVEKNFSARCQIYTSTGLTLWLDLEFDDPVRAEISLEPALYLSELGIDKINHSKSPLTLTYKGESYSLYKEENGTLYKNCDKNVIWNGKRFDPNWCLKGDDPNMGCSFDRLSYQKEGSEEGIIKLLIEKNRPPVIHCYQELKEERIQIFALERDLLT